MENFERNGSRSRPGSYDRSDAARLWGFHIFRDGNSWCAVGPNFLNLQESVAGFGSTSMAAYAQWLVQRTCQRDRRGALPPRYKDFTIHLARR
jgi:hypothetical protein